MITSSLNSVRKTIYEHTAGGGTFRNGFIFSTFCGPTLAKFQELAATAKKDFPWLTDEEIECRVVIRSSYNKGTLYIRFPLMADSECNGYYIDKNIPNFS